ncbi:MAG: RCC1 domain-containing protein [Polyangiales bacterium]
MARRSPIARLLFASLPLSALCACAANAGDEGALAAAPHEGDTSTVTASLASVPPGVLCLQVTVGAFTKTTSVSTTGNTTSVALGTLPAGAQTAQAMAYNAACGTVPMPSPTWASAAQTVVIASAGATLLNFEMLAEVPSTANVDFVTTPVAISGGTSQTFAIMADGSLRGWGGMFNQQSLVPLALTGFPTVTSIVAAGSAASCALFASGLGCWGSNYFGQFGTGAATTTVASSPVFPVSASGRPFTSISVGVDQVCGLTSTSPGAVDVECWGTNTSGQVNGVAGTPQLKPVVIALSSSYQPIAITAGAAASCAIDAAHVARCWGANTYGSFGNGTTTVGAAAVTTLFGGAYVNQVAITNGAICVLKLDGTVWCSGFNGTDGALGSGSTSYSLPSPVQVTGLAGVTQIAANLSFRSFYALNAAGVVSAWGNNFSGQLGDGTTTNRSSPVTVLGLTGVTSITAGSDDACAIKTDGTTWCWGGNQLGELGDGTVTSRYTPVRVKL